MRSALRRVRSRASSVWPTRALTAEASGQPLPRRSPGLLAHAAKAGAAGVGALSAVAVGQAVYLRYSYASPDDPEGSTDGQAGQEFGGAPVKVLFVGDSVAIGVGALRAAPLQAAFAARLSKLRGRPVTWTTVGGTGEDSRGLRAMLARDAEAESFDVAVVLCGINDGKRLLEGRWPSVFREDLESLCAEVRRHVPGPEGTILVPRIPGYMRAPQLQLWPMKYFIRLFFEPYDAQKLCVATAMGIDSPTPPLERLPSPSDTHLWAGDGMHPSGEGYEVIGEWLAVQCHETRAMPAPARGDAVPSAGGRGAAATTAAAALALGLGWRAGAGHAALLEEAPKEPAKPLEEAPKEPAKPGSPKPEQPRTGASAKRGGPSISCDQEMLRLRRIFMTGDINDDSAKVIIQQLLFLESDDPHAPVTIFINSGGGVVHSGLAILDIMSHVSMPVRTVAYGRCFSIAALLLAAGSPGHRSAYPNTRLMVHEPSCSYPKLQATDMVIKIEELKHTQRTLEDIMAANTGRPREEIAAAIQRDRYMSVQEAVEFGLVDAVIDGRPRGIKDDKETSATPAR